MMRDRVLAFDPGVTTGVALLTPRVIRTWTLSTYDGFASLPILPHLVLIERLFNNPAMDIRAFEFAGACRLWSTQQDSPFVIQEPFVPEFITRRYQLRNTLPTQHEFDALCHLIHYYHKRKSISEVEDLIAYLKGRTHGDNCDTFRRYTNEVTTSSSPTTND